MRARNLETRGEPSPVTRSVKDTIECARILFPEHGLLSINDDLGYDAVRAVERKAVELAEAMLTEREGK